MASITKRCRHPRDHWDTCRCVWYIRDLDGKRTVYTKVGRDRGSAARALALHKVTPPRLREVGRAPGLELPEQKGCSWIYFVAGANLTKVGLTTDLRARMATLQASSPVVLTLVLVLTGGREVERMLHARYDAFRRHGEWFALPIGWENEPDLLHLERP